MSRSPLVLAAIACAGGLACAAVALPRAGESARSAPDPAPIATSPPAPPDPCALGVPDPDGATPLARALRSALEDAHFEDVIDLGPSDDPSCPAGPRCATAPIARRPSVDVAVIAFAPGCKPALANAMMSRSAPGVHLAAIDPESLSVRGVRYRAWDQARWDAADSDDTAALPDLGDVVPPPREAAFTLEVPYPASNFKLLVAVFTLSLVDRGALRLDGEIAFNKKKRPLREWLSDMITWSDDESTQAIVKALHGMKRMEELNPFFARLGLSTLQIHDTSPRNGRNWQPGRIHMTAWDTARLLWLLDPDAPPPPWSIQGAFLRPESKALLLDLLGEQAFHDVLSTTALCGVERTARGILALYPSRWIGADGRAQVESGAHGGDIRPCNTEAQVTFAHKTGLTLNFGSDAGIVRGIPGRARRHYIVTFFSNLGHRYTDRDKASGPNPCRELGICYTQRIAALGAAIDAAVAGVIDPIDASPAR